MLRLFDLDSKITAGDLRQVIADSINKRCARFIDYETRGVGRSLPDGVDESAENFGRATMTSLDVRTVAFGFEAKNPQFPANIGDFGDVALRVDLPCKNILRKQNLPGLRGDVFDKQG